MALATFGERLMAYREELGMSQKVLAERAGLTPSYLNRIEKGTRRPPTVSKVLAMIQVLRLTRSQAEELASLAGYSPLILASGGSLSYSSPSLPETSPTLLDHDMSRLRDLLGKLSPEQRKDCIDALIALIVALTDDDEAPKIATER